MYIMLSLFKIDDISLDVCTCCSVSWREKFNNDGNPNRFFIVLKCEIQNCWYFVGSMHNKLRHTDGETKWWWTSLLFLIVLKWEIQNCWYFGGRMHKKLVAQMEKLNNDWNPCCFLMVLKCEIQNCWYFGRSMQKIGPEKEVATPRYEIQAHLYSLKSLLEPL